MERGAIARRAAGAAAGPGADVARIRTAGRGAEALGRRGAAGPRAGGSGPQAGGRLRARDDEEGAVAALRICIENAGAGPLVGMAWRRLVELYARRGDPHAAARALISSADDTRTGALESRARGGAGRGGRDPAQAAGAAGTTRECCWNARSRSTRRRWRRSRRWRRHDGGRRLRAAGRRPGAQAGGRGARTGRAAGDPLAARPDLRGPAPNPDRARLLRERMALIDLETTPMVPIPPPDTRVGVPPVPEARRRPRSTARSRRRSAGRR